MADKLLSFIFFLVHCKSMLCKGNLHRRQYVYARVIDIVKTWSEINVITFPLPFVLG